LERLIGMIGSYDDVVDKAFTQRPIFSAWPADYALLASKFFQG
jgi:hypothetical protein